VRNERHLIYVPILHTVSDMGTLSGSMRDTYVKKFGAKKWQEHVSAIEEMWDGISRKVRALKLPFKKVKIYQDGLPLCGKEREIVDDLARKGSLNHRLVLWMIHRGASLVGTEDPQLLVREYEHLRGIAGARTHRERERLVHEFEGEAGSLLKKRDQAIRDRIVSTLNRGESGVVFMGLLHRVDELVPPYISVHYLIHRLPFRRSFAMEMVA
jgi:hypothetical protein